MRLLTLFFFLLVNMISYAQESSIAKIRYIFKHVNDTTVPDKFLRDQVATFLGTHSTYYTSVSNEEISAQMKEQMNRPDFDGTLVLNKNSTPTVSSYLIDYNKKQLEHIHRIASDKFIMKEEFPELDWNILDETKEIGGYTCQKASTTFKGRTYEAWFTTEIPMSFGPWKLQGLPGLILAASDTKHEVMFEYDGFEKTEGDLAVTIGPTENVIQASKQDVEKLEKAFKENPNAYLQSKNNRSISGGIVVMGSRKSSAAPSATASKGALDPSKIKSMTVKNAEDYKPSNVTNNPIELTP